MLPLHSLATLTFPAVAALRARVPVVFFVMESLPGSNLADVTVSARRRKIRLGKLPVDSQGGLGFCESTGFFIRFS